MAIVKCTYCKFVREIPNQHEGKRTKCPYCQTVLYVQNAIALITDLSEELLQSHETILQLKQDVRLARDNNTKIESGNAFANLSTAPTKQKSTAPMKQDVRPTCDNGTKIKKTKKTKSGNASANLSTAPMQQNVHPTCDNDTKIKSGYAFANLSTSPIFENYDDVIQWFGAKHITVIPNKAAMDISGFFDEVAVKLGDNYGVLRKIYENIKRSQDNRGEFTVNLTSHSQKDTQIITGFLKELYDSAFITRYTHDKINKRVHVSLQTTPTIMNFFKGDWLEWYALMKVATLLVDKKLKFSCLRGFEVIFPNEDRHEIDLFFLINGSIPVWIECKTGEFRQFIGKYATLRNRLNLNKSNALLLVLGVPDEKVVGLTNTFDLTIVNENNFLTHIGQKI